MLREYGTSSVPCIAARNLFDTSPVAASASCLVFQDFLLCQLFWAGLTLNVLIMRSSWRKLLNGLMPGGNGDGNSALQARSTKSKYRRH